MALLLVACSGDDDVASTTSTTQGTTTTEATTTTTATTTSTSTTTTAAPPTTVASTTTAPPDGDGPPPLNPVPADGDDLEEYARIYREHIAYQNWLARHPTTDPQVLGLVFHPEGPAYERFRVQMRFLLDEGRHIEDDLFIDLFSLAPGADPNVGILPGVAFLKRNHLRVIDVATGEVVAGSDEGQEFDVAVELRSHDNGRWLIWLQDEDVQ